MLLLLVLSAMLGTFARYPRTCLQISSWYALRNCFMFSTLVLLSRFRFEKNRSRILHAFVPQSEKGSRNVFAAPASCAYRGPVFVPQSRLIRIQLVCQSLPDKRRFWYPSLASWTSQPRRSRLCLALTRETFQPGNESSLNNSDAMPWLSWNQSGQGWKLPDELTRVTQHTQHPLQHHDRCILDAIVKGCSADVQTTPMKTYAPAFSQWRSRHKAEKSLSDQPCDRPKPDSEHYH